MLEQMKFFRTSYLLSKVGGSIQEKEKKMYVQLED